MIILRAEACPKRRFFVQQHKKVEEQPDETTVFNERRVSKNQTRAENCDDHRNIHGISNITIQSGNNQMTGGKDRRRCAETLHCESAKRIQEANDAKRYRHSSDEMNNGRSEKRRFESPVGDPPRRQTGYETGGDH